MLPPFLKKDNVKYLILNEHEIQLLKLLCKKNTFFKNLSFNEIEEQDLHERSNHL